MADRRLQVFYTVARMLSFTKAAETLHMTQPAVTFQVRQLEDYFNTRLFDRTHNRVALTEAGRKIYEYCERIFELYAEIRADPEPQRAWRRWCAVREELFRSHPQSPSRDARPVCSEPMDY